jgi:LPS-assembly protein
MAVLCHPLLWPRLVTSQLLPASDPQKSPATSKRTPVDVTIAAEQQERDGDLYKLRGNVKIDYGTYIISGDEATYNSDSGEVQAEGHLVLDGGPNDEHVEATRANYNLQSEKGTFEHATGSIGIQMRKGHAILTSPNPFFFTGKVVVKAGPDHYIVTDGKVTTCQLPRPKWQFYAHKVDVEVGANASIYNSDFRIEGIPVFYFPFATHPVQKRPRQSGFLIPNAGKSSIRGYTFGESAFWAINPSMDLLAGTEYFSRRGWAPQGQFRAQASENAFADLTYFSVFDRGVGGVNQGGTEVGLNAQDTFPHNFRGVANIDYLSSYIFRLVFSDVFSQVVNSEVKSQIFLSNTTNDFFVNATARRYQDFQSGTDPRDVITILHVPGVEASTIDQKLGASPFYGNFDFSLEGLSRSEPGFSTAPLLGRVDVSPVISLPLLVQGWSFRPAISVRDTIYTQQLTPAGGTNGLGAALSDALNRKSLEGSVELRPPAVERVFGREFLGRKWKHVIEPRILYDYVTGVSNFAKLLRFDDRDILSDTNEVEYGIVNRFYAKRASPATEDCGQEGMLALIVGAAAPPAKVPWDRTVHTAQQQCPVEPDTREVVTWELAQKYFADPTFGGALVPGKRNVFTSTIDLTGIAFLIEPQHLSPLISRLRIETSSRDDLEWDADYDFNFGRVNTSTVLFNHHFGLFTLGAGDALLHIPGQITGPTILNTGPPAEKFDQVRAVFGYGNPNKRGFSGAVNLGFDVNLNQIQYDSTQFSYNWDCCGINVEYRRFELANVRNENQFRFTFALANVGAFGNLRRTERLY